MAEYKQPQVIPNANIAYDVDPNTLHAQKMGKRSATPRVSAGDPGANDTKTDGVKIRGTGAATKGVMARGPMA